MRLRTFSNRRAIGGVVAALSVLAFASTACSGKSKGGGTPTRSPGDLWDQLKRAGESSELWTPSQLGDLGSLADAVVIGRVTAYNGVTQIPPVSAVGKGAGVAHFTVSVDRDAGSGVGGGSGVGFGSVVGG